MARARGITQFYRQPTRKVSRSQTDVLTTVERNQPRFILSRNDDDNNNDDNDDDYDDANCRRRQLLRSRWRWILCVVVCVVLLVAVIVTIFVLLVTRQTDACHCPTPCGPSSYYISNQIKFINAEGPIGH